MESIAVAIGTGLLTNLITEVSKKGVKSISVKKDDFLNYDTSFSLSNYKRSHPVSPFIPYEQEILLLDSDKEIEILVKETNFILSAQSDLWKEVSNKAFKEFKKDRTSENGSAIRLEGFELGNNKIILKVQKAGYYDQAKSNLVLDYKASNDSKSLRDLLSKEYYYELPPLNTSYLANTVGIAIVIFYEVEGEWIPYMVKRAKNVGVFPGGLHCTASGVAKWPKNHNNDFNTFFMDHMYQEIFEEVGLSRDEIYDVKPISLCREFSRAGKPQIFFGAKTKLERCDLKVKRKQAAKWSKDHGLRQEIEEGLFTSEVVKSSDEILNNVRKYSVTLEGIASLYFGKIYLDSFK